MIRKGYQSLQSSSADGAAPRSRWFCSHSIGPTACFSGRPWAGRQPRRRPGKLGWCEGTDGDASLLRLQHGRLLPALAGHAMEDPEPSENFPSELVPQGQERKVLMARVRRKHAGAEV